MLIVEETDEEDANEEDDVDEEEEELTALRSCRVLDMTKGVECTSETQTPGPSFEKIHTAQ